MTSAAEGGECAVTPEIPVVETSSTAVVDTSASLSRKPRPGDVVTFTILKFQPESDENDDNPLVLEPLFDTTGTLQLVLDGGNYLPGLHKILSTLTPGETVKGVSIDAGYGAYNPELVMKISTSEIGNSLDTSLVKIGTALQMGNGMQCRVTEINDEQWTMDANHMLAGAAYEVDVKLDMVEEGPTSWEYVAEGTDDRYKAATFALGCFWGGGEFSLLHELGVHLMCICCAHISFSAQLYRTGLSENARSNLNSHWIYTGAKGESNIRGSMYWNHWTY